MARKKTTSAERMRKMREKMSIEEKEKYREKNKQQQKASRAKQTKERRMAANEKSVERKKMWRAMKRFQPTSQPVSPRKTFNSAQAFGRALRRVQSHLPSSPRKKNAVVTALSRRYKAVEIAAQEKMESELDKAVKEYYESDSISWQMPGKKDFVTIKTKKGRERKQKRLLLSTVREAHQQFKVDNPHLKIGKSKFAALRPQHVLPIAERDQNVCCCIYHENFELLVTGMNRSLSLNLNPNSLIENSVCATKHPDCFLDHCELCRDKPNVLIEDLIPFDDAQQSVRFYQWTERIKKEERVENLVEAKKELVERLKFVKKHDFIAKTQHRQKKLLTNKLTPGEIVLHEDFSENYAVKQQNEIMTAHWEAQGITIFTALITSSSKSKSYVVVTDDLKHDKTAVMYCNQEILKDFAQDEQFHKVHFYSDGAVSQFKNRFILSTLPKPSVFHDKVKEADWNFFATAHGKGPIDGIGGTVKRAVWRRVLQKKSVVNNAKEFCDVARERCPGIKIIFLDDQFVKEKRSQFSEFWDENDMKPIKDTRAMHHFSSTIEGNLHASETTQYFPLIANASGLPTNDFETEIKIEVQETEEQNQPSCSKAPSVVKCQIQEPIEVGKYYAVDYLNRFYVGRVLEKSDKHEFYVMKFLHKFSEDGNPIFRWPKTDDVDHVHQSNIFFGPIVLHGFLDYSVLNLTEIEAKFKDIC